VVWTISGTDSGGGAGIHADTRAFDAFGLHGACAVAAVTAQHSRAVTHVEPVSPALLDAQLGALADDMPPDAIKTGLLGSLENLRVVVAWVRRVRERFPDKPIPLVVDPVFGATTGAAFADHELRIAYRNELLPLATLATPNVAEARALVPSSQLLDPVTLARAWRGFGVRAVVVTGGDSDCLGEDEIEHLSTAHLASRLAEIDARAAWAHDWLDAEHGLRSRGWLASRRIACLRHQSERLLRTAASGRLQPAGEATMGVKDTARVAGQGRRRRGEVPGRLLVLIGPTQRHFSRPRSATHASC
jgi:hydroxymethylpyrimidine kinase/phosphomethylpyrimidine kinase